MLRDYEVRFYNRLAARKRELSENDFAVAREIVAWKHKVLAAWPAVKIVDVQRARVGDKPIFIGRSSHFELTLDLAGLAPEDVGAELVVARPVEPDRVVEVIRTVPLSQVQVSGSQVTFTLDYVPEQAGMFDMALRIFRRIRCCRIVWISHWSSGREIVVAKRLFFDKFRIFAELGLDGLRKNGIFQKR